MTRKTLRNILWLLAAGVAIMAVCCNPSHLATASILFILGTFQDEEDNGEYDDQYYDKNLRGF